MPIYEYRCPKCGDFDVMQKITENPLKRCPTCKGKVSKLLSNPAFHLKGGGWYVTDYARKDKDKGGGDKGADGAEKKAADGPGESSSSGDSSSAGDKKSEKSDKQGDKKGDKKGGKKGDTSASAAA